MLATGALAPGQLDEVQWLRRHCEVAAGTDLKLVLPTAPRGPVASQFLAVSDGAVVGYAGVDIGIDPEVCGMVHPEHRRRGIGAALLDSTLAATRLLGRESALFICEDAEPLAAAWLRRRGGVLNSSELRMLLRLSEAAAAGEAGPSVDLRPSRPQDRDALVRLLTEGFVGMTPALAEEMVGRHDEPGEESLLAWDNDQVVATLRLTRAGDRWMVYGVVVDPARRGRGYGGAAMRAALEILRGRGADEVSLEVEPDNTPAVRLYRRLGFRTITTYRYIRVPATARRQPPEATA